MPEHSIVFCLSNSVGEPPYPIRVDSLQYQKHIMPEHSIVFCLCNSVGVALRPPPVAEKGSIALSEITSKRKHIYVQRIATIFQTGGHWTPALMKQFV